MAPRSAILAAAMMLHRCEAWSWISSSFGGGAGAAFGTASDSAVAAVSPEHEEHMKNERAKALDYVKDTAAYWWTGYDKAYEDCVTEFVYGTTPQGNLWTAGFRHTPTALKTHCGNMWSYMEKMEMTMNNNTAITDHQKQQWRDYMWRWYAHDCSLENQVAYPGCIDWMPDDCVNVGTGEIRLECYTGMQRHATINQACKDIAVASGCNEKAYEITAVLNKDITAPPEDAYTNFKEVRDALAEKSDNNIMTVGNEMLDGMVAKCEFASVKGTFPVVQAALDQMMGTSCLDIAQQMMVLENIMTSTHVDERCPVGIPLDECHTWVQHNTGGVPKWVPYVVGSAALLYVGAAVNGAMVAKSVAARCLESCRIAWAAGKKVVMGADEAKMIADTTWVLFR